MGKERFPQTPPTHQQIHPWGPPFLSFSISKQPFAFVRQEGLSQTNEGQVQQEVVGCVFCWKSASFPWCIAYQFCSKNFFLNFCRLGWQSTRGHYTNSSWSLLSLKNQVTGRGRTCSLESKLSSTISYPVTFKQTPPNAGIAPLWLEIYKYCINSHYNKLRHIHWLTGKSLEGVESWDVVFSPLAIWGLNASLLGRSHSTSHEM